MRDRNQVAATPQIAKYIHFPTARQAFLLDGTGVRDVRRLLKTGCVNHYLNFSLPFEIET